MKIWDIVITAGVVLIAVWYLYRKFVVNRGCSCGTDCATTKGACQVQPGVDEQGGAETGTGDKQQ